jgi:hypothetical protein
VSRASPERGLSFAQNQLGETCTSHLNHVPCGLPSVKSERQPLKREACVGRGRQLLKQRESLSDLRDHLRVA